MGYYKLGTLELRLAEVEDEEEKMLTPWGYYAEAWFGAGGL